MGLTEERNRHDTLAPAGQNVEQQDFAYFSLDWHCSKELISTKRRIYSKHSGTFSFVKVIAIYDLHFC